MAPNESDGPIVYWLLRIPHAPTASALAILWVFVVKPLLLVAFMAWLLNAQCGIDRLSAWILALPGTAIIFFVIMLLKAAINGE